MKRHLSRDEAALWARLTGTVSAINPPQNGEVAPPLSWGDGGVSLRKHPVNLEKPLRPAKSDRGEGAPPRSGEDQKSRAPNHNTLDANWDRKLARGVLSPDFTLDLHGLSLDAAYTRLHHGLTLAVAQQARVVLLITGRPRPVDPADRGSKRGAIRAKVMDWLASGPQASQIAAIRPAHPRHGGAGAVYVVLRRGRPFGDLR